MSKVVKNNAILKYNTNQEIKTCDVSTIIEPGLQVHKRAITAADGVIEADEGETEATGKVGKDRKIIYELVLSNYSTKDFNNITISDKVVLPEGYETSFEVTSDNAVNAAEKPNIQFSIPKLAKESTSVVRYEVKLDDSVPVGTLVSNQASVNYTENPKPETPVKTEALKITVDYTETTISATKTAPASVLFGESYDYEMEFKNTGDQIAKPTSIEDELQEDFTLKSVKVYVDDSLKKEDTDYTLDTTDNKVVITPIGENLNIPVSKTLKIVINGVVNE